MTLFGFCHPSLCNAHCLDYSAGLVIQMKVSELLDDDDNNNTTTTTNNYYYLKLKKAKGKMLYHYVPKAGASTLYTKMNEILSLKCNSVNLSII